MAMDQNDWDVKWGYGVLTHGRMFPEKKAKKLKKQGKRGRCGGEKRRYAEAEERNAGKSPRTNLLVASDELVQGGWSRWGRGCEGLGCGGAGRLGRWERLRGGRFFGVVENSRPKGRGNPFAISNHGGGGGGGNVKPVAMMRAAEGLVTAGFMPRVFCWGQSLLDQMGSFVFARGSLRLIRQAQFGASRMVSCRLVGFFMLVSKKGVGLVFCCGMGPQINPF